MDFVNCPNSRTEFFPNTCPQQPLHDLHQHQQSFWQYSDNPNKYKVQESHPSYRFLCGEITIDVKFPAEAELMVKPPDPEIISIHAAFARVLSP